MIPTLIIMAKQPRAGQVKTRLGREIGMVSAAWWYRHQLRTLVRRLDDPRWQTVLAVAPDMALLSPALPGGAPRVPQGRGDLGARMRRLLNAAPGPACLIGSDIPGIRRQHIARAFRRLGGQDAVFGPSNDGGYWLIGRSAGAQIPPLTNIRWSTEFALSDTIAAMPGKRIALTDTLRDVDTAADLS